MKGFWKYDQSVYFPTHLVYPIEFFVFAPPTESERDIPIASSESNNELTRAWVMGRDNREFGQNSYESGCRCPHGDVARDTLGETKPRRA